MPSFKDYDFFLSHLRKENRPIPATSPWRRISVIHGHILAGHWQVFIAPRPICFDTEAIRDANDWWHSIFCGLRRTRMPLVRLSSAWFLVLDGMMRREPHADVQVSSVHCQHQPQFPKP